MRTIDRSTAFRRDYKKESKGKHRKLLDEVLIEALESLLVDAPLAHRYRDHELVGNWVGYRECHLKPDLLLIYKKVGDQVLHLARLGSHSKLFNK